MLVVRRLSLFVLITLMVVPGWANVDPMPQGRPLSEKKPPAIEELTIVSAGKRMPGLLYMANGPGPHPTLILLHGFPGNEKNLDIAQAVRRSGFNVLFFHYRGAWGAEGSYRATRLNEDVAAVLAFLRHPDNASSLRVEPTRLSLLGHSLGGFTALAAGRNDDQLVCVGAMSPVNLALWKAGLTHKDANTQRVLDYADSLFMLADFNGEVLREELQSTATAELDTTGFAEGLRGKSVLLVTGEQDLVTPAKQMHTPVVESYAKESTITLHHHLISGDHSFSWSRIPLTALIIDWLSSDCR